MAVRERSRLTGNVKPSTAGKRHFCFDLDADTEFVDMNVNSFIHSEAFFVWFFVKDSGVVFKLRSCYSCTVIL